MTPYPYDGGDGMLGMPRRGGGMFGMPRQGMYSQGGMFAANPGPPTYTGQGMPIMKGMAPPVDYSSLGGAMGNVYRGPGGSPPMSGGMGMPQTGGPMSSGGGLPPWLMQMLSQRVQGGMLPPQQPAAAPMPAAPAAPQQPPVDPAVQAYMDQNYFKGIAGGPDPRSFSMPGADPAQPKGLVMSEGGQPSPFARPLTGNAPPPGTTNGPGGLGFATPGQPTQLFGPTAGLFGGAMRPQGVPNNFGYYTGTQQWGAPNMGWAPQWGRQPGV